MEYYNRKALEIGFFIAGIIIIAISIVIAYMTKGAAGNLTTALLILGTVVSFITYALLEYFDFIKMKKVEEVFPRFLRDYAEALNSGLNFNQAFELISKNDYGALNEYIKRAKNRLSLNIPFPRVLKMMQKEMKNSPTIRNSLDIIINSYYSGGNIAITMMDLSETVLSIREIYEEKKTILNQQVMILYAVFIIFLIIIVSLYYVLKPVTEIQGAQIGEMNFQLTNFCEYSAVYPVCTLGYVFGYTPQDKLTYFKMLLFFMALIEAISVGALIGVITEGNVKAGLNHIAIMLSLVLLIFGIGIY